jgi:phage terminase large subunit-like protein
MNILDQYYQHLENCSSNLGYFFTELVWPACVPNEKFHKSPYGFDLMVEYAMAWEMGQIPNLIILVAPRNGKTKLLSVALPTWIWINKPSSRILSISNSPEVCEDFRLDRERVLLDSDYKKLFTCFDGKKSVDIKITKDAEGRVENSEGGYFASWPILNSKTGMGSHYIIVDDPILNKMKRNRAHCEKVADEFANGLLQRRNSQNVDCMSPAMITMQSLSEFDLGQVMKDRGFEVLELQSYAEERQVLIFPLSGKEWIREPLDVLNPELQSLETLFAIQKKVPNFRAQYNQRPKVENKNAIVKTEDLKKYDKLPKFSRIILSADTAATDEVDSSNWAFEIYGECYTELGIRYYLLHAHAEKFEYPQGKSKLENLLESWHVNVLLIEFKSTGLALAPALDLKYKNLEVIRYTSNVPKKDRQLEALPKISFGYILFPDLSVFPHCVWMSLVDYEITAFPSGKTDDLLDCKTQLLNYYIQDEVNIDQFYKILDSAT